MQKKEKNHYLYFIKSLNFFDVLACALLKALTQKKKKTLQNKNHNQVLISS